MNLGYLQITRLCNQSCRICSNPDRDATLDEKAATERIDEMISGGYDGVILTGGEPTLHPELARLISYCSARSFHCRIVSNGQKLGRRDYLNGLVGAGLGLIHLSIISHHPYIQNVVTGNRSSHENLVSALYNLSRESVPLVINIPINHYNARSLREQVQWVLDRAPRVGHFVFDFLDPLQNRASENPDVIPALWEVKLPLRQALDYLASTGRTFRVERLPLCYMSEWAHCSTETRKIVQSEDRLIHFLDEKETHRRVDWQFGKGGACERCDLEPVCAGLWEMGAYHSPAELQPIKGSARSVARRVLEG